MANGDHDWVAAEVVTAANMDDYLQLQTVQKFATSAARDTALSARKREGMLTYQDDANALTSYSGTVWSTIGPVSGAGLTWAPTITQSVSVAYTNNSGTYHRMGRRIFATGKFTLTASGTAANLLTITLPVTAISGNDGGVIGNGYIEDASAGNRYLCYATQATTGSIVYLSMTGSNTDTSQRFGTGGVTVAVASSDVVSLCLCYEAAADG